MLTNSLVVVAGMATTIVVAMIVGPPMIRRLMDQAIAPGVNGNHPYEGAFRDATALRAFWRHDVEQPDLLSFAEQQRLWIDPSRGFAVVRAPFLHPASDLA